MTASQNGSHKRYSSLVAAILLLLLGGLGIYIGSHNYPIRALGVAAVIASAYSIRLFYLHERSDLLDASERRANFTKGPGRLLWLLSITLVPLLGVAFYLLHVDAKNGGQEAWPADVFAGVGLTCAIVWGYLVAKIFWGSAKFQSRPK